MVLTNEEIRQMVVVMREDGIRRMRLGQVEIELWDAKGPVVPLESDDVGVSTTAPTSCNCPHADFEHDPDGMCLQGCTPEKCATKRP